MVHKDYIYSLGIVALVGWTAWLLVLLKLEPCHVYSSTTFCESISGVAITFFYASLLFALSATFALVGYIARVKLYHNEVFSSHLNISLRQGILLSICSISCLGLLSLGVLKWWTTLVVFTMIIFIEFFFLNREGSN